ncbi:nicotinate-nucleotide adenylyltransferase [Neorickettsia sennetsu]|uniref:Probable nicotinate-nucleotide adenylyltransferase n=1 Tax=Ehrlichia sennetsu (strain ATCC VR-367 / Miyayama) TaxID=222891 RepID=Q2GD59_EHRS3|nr:nicotinate-nucleotide adenylyltransferase [Neorickettsia sennetsu]ABD46182.1 putative nicotinate (nicotinamide) nucleotide adenylyltransferase [Neorickettsia sennetsu str. Miyayama]
MSLKIGLLGGSFNPPHTGHLYISLEALKRLNLHQVWWLFCRKNPLKQIYYIPCDIRVEMARTLIGINKKIKLINSDDVYTYKTLRKLTSQYPHYDFTWIAGMDSIMTIHAWENWKEIIRKVRFALFDRENFFHKCMRSRFISCVDRKRVSPVLVKKRDISSTLLRSENEWYKRISESK